MYKRFTPPAMRIYIRYYFYCLYCGLVLPTVRVAYVTA